MLFNAELGCFCHNARIKTYPDGSREILVCSKGVFREPGWEEKHPKRRHQTRAKPYGLEEPDEFSGESAKRAQRRARSRVRDIALSNPFTHFVTLTLDPAKVDRYDMGPITRRLNHWLCNQVRRKGLIYVLVPERHKDGAIHFHGFFNDALERVDSGTMIPPEGGKPRKPSSKAQMAEWAEKGGRVVWNLPGWSLGFTTALELRGSYPKAVSYVCKYIGKQGDKPGGRWYYSGGKLEEPKVELCDLDFRDVWNMGGGYMFDVPEAGAVFLRVLLKAD